MEDIKETFQSGRLLWLDGLTRSKIKALARDGVTGAILRYDAMTDQIRYGGDYDEQISSQKEKDVGHVLEALLLEDARRACDVLENAYRNSGRTHGFVSVPLPPGLAYDAQETVNIAKRLASRIERDNLMIRLPATRESLLAMRQLLLDGISVHVTDVFSIEHYERALKTYMRAIEDRDIHYRPLDRVASVADFCVAAVDELFDRLLMQRMTVSDPQKNCDIRDKLIGQTATAMARLIYKKFTRYFGGQSWGWLQDHNAIRQKILWRVADSSNSNASLDEYFNDLSGEDVLFAVSADVAKTDVDPDDAPGVERDVEKAGMIFTALGDLDISVSCHTQQLLAESLIKTLSDYYSAIQAIEEKVQVLGG